MKKITLFLALLPFTFLWSQQAYYNDVNLNKTGQALKSELATKITTTHVNKLSYTPGIWEACKITDANPTNTANVLLVYGYEPGLDGTIDNDRERGVNNNGDSSGWNREHVFARSLGNPNLEYVNAGADAFNLRPSDATRNSVRSNRKFAEGSGVSAIVGSDWYPGDEWKGDIARTIMYMYVHYGSQCLPTAVGVGSSATTADDMIDLFLKWNREDPVSSFEEQRNTYHDSNATYAQGNRNPFIDNPYLATLIWGGTPAEDRWSISVADSESPTQATNLVVSNAQPTSLQLSWTAATDNIGVSGYEVFVNGVLNTTTGNTTAILTNLVSETTYSINVVAKDVKGNRSLNSTTVQGTTSAHVLGVATELFFSEYVEGSGFNKAVEIANFTNDAIDLSSYDIRKQSNGVGNWASKFTLSGSLQKGKVHVLVSSASTNTVLTDKADVLVVDNYPTNPSPLNFNGNDAVGLFKNDVLIDIIGVFDDATMFGENVTLRRKNTIAKPNIVFDKTAEWNTFNQDNFDDLGQHELNSILSVTSLESIHDLIRVYYANEIMTVVKSNHLNLNEITIYNLSGQLIRKVDLKNRNENTIQIQNLPKGILLIEFATENTVSRSKILIY